MPDDDPSVFVFGGGIFGEGADLSDLPEVGTVLGGSSKL